MVAENTSSVAGGGTSHDTVWGRGGHSLLSAGQFGAVTGLGIVFWLVGVWIIRYGVMMGVFGGVTGVASFVAGIPMAWMTVWFVKRAARLEPHQIVPGIAVGCGAAALCDGTALTWAHTIYGATPELVLPGAGYLLWVFGLTLAAAYFDAGRTFRN